MVQAYQPLRIDSHAARYNAALPETRETAEEEQTNTVRKNGLEKSHVE